MNALHLDIADDVACLTFDLPGSRANTLGQAVQEEFEKALDAVEARDDLRGLILGSGKPGMFIAGADIKELSAPDLDPEVVRRLVERGLRLIARFEKLPFPTVALIDGSCLGGGLELALGFDHRLGGTHPKLEIGLPEVKLGLIPGWGGTQRLTRTLGPVLAAELICAGESTRGTRCRELGLVDDVVPSERLLQEGKRLLTETARDGTWREVRRRKQLPVGLTEEQVDYLMDTTRAAILARTGGHQPAPLAALEAIGKGCNLPLDEGLALETDLFVPLVGSTVSRNLIAIFFQNQRLAKDPGVADAAIKPRDLQRAGVIGAGLMGSGIAGAHVRRGVPTLMVDQNQEAVDRGRGTIVQVAQGRIQAGRATQEELVQALAALTTGSAGTDPRLADCDLVVEAVVEDESVKTALFAGLGDLLRPGTILCTNTSTISITRLARTWKEPENFAGLHFFNPVDRMALVEVIRGEATSDATTATLVAHARKIGKTPIVVRDGPGFLVNRILFPYIDEALVLLEEGVPARAIDRAATDFGMPMGPLTLNDLVGLDTSLFAGRVLHRAFPERAAESGILEELVKQGRLGKKTGTGFYDYRKDKRGADDPALAAILAKFRRTGMDLDAEGITDRLFLPMVTEASRVLMEGLVRSPEDVDMGLILGLGFPNFRGGLLRWADSQGLPEVLRRLERYASLGPRYHPTEQMRELAAEGTGFYGSRK